MLLFASAAVLHYVAIRIPYLAFFAHDSGIRTREPPVNMLLAMGLAATLSIIVGCLPGALYSLLPFPVEYLPYTYTHVVAQLQLLFFSALAFVWLVQTGRYPAVLPSINLDAEWVYRKLLPHSLKRITHVSGRLHLRMRFGVLRRLGTVLGALFLYHGPQGILARTWSTGSMVLWVVILLGIYLVAYYY